MAADLLAMPVALLSTGDLVIRMTKTEIKKIQYALNFFVKKYVKGFQPLLIDGKMGAKTERRIQWCKYFLGYYGNVTHQTPTVNLAFRQRLWHPKNVRYSTPKRISRGMSRRSAQRAKWRKNTKSAAKRSGVGRYDGVPVANVAIPYLQWAREHGWQGKLVSGWRDPNYSRSLCIRMCGA